MQNLPLDKDTASIVNEYLMVSEFIMDVFKRGVIQQIKMINYFNYVENYGETIIPTFHQQALSRAKCQDCGKRTLIGDKDYEVGRYCDNCTTDEYVESAHSHFNRVTTHIMGLD